MNNINPHRIRSITIFIVILLTICILGLGCATSGEAPEGDLFIEGKGVKDKVSFTMEDLKAMEDGLIEADYFALNSHGTKGYSHFKGIWTGYILNEKLALKDKASQVTFIAGDGYEVEYTLEEVMREDYIDEQNPETKYKMILAWEENGRELNSLQLVVGQRKPGDVNKPYWVRNVKTIRID